MNYFSVKSVINGSQKKVLELQQSLLSGYKNRALSVFRNYYQGQHWDVSDEFGAKGNSTTSGKLMFEEKDPTRKARKLSNGELKVWNITQAVIDIYTTYCRGIISDSSRIEIEDDINTSKLINEAIGDFDMITLRTVRRMSTDSVAVWKYMQGGLTEFIDAMEIFPIYWGDKKVGTIRVYKIDENDPMITEEVKSMRKAKKDEVVYYMEVWLPAGISEDGKPFGMELHKFIDGIKINPEQVVAPFPFDPYILVINKNSEYSKFDADHTEISDVENVIDIQDDINVYVTDLNLITRQVSMPMWKLVDSVYEKMMNGELSAETVKESLEKITLQAGRIVAAPLQREAGEGLPVSSVQYLQELFNQLSRITGIPTIIFNSEGLGNVATETVQHVTESLRRRIDEKRTSIEQAMKQYAHMLLSESKGEMVEDKNLDDKLSVEWAEIMGMNKSQKADLVIRGAQAQVLPKTYAIEELLTIFGDAERLNEVIGMMDSNNLSEKIGFERQRITQESQKEIEKVKQETSQAVKERDLNRQEILKLVAEV